MGLYKRTNDRIITGGCGLRRFLSIEEDISTSIMLAGASPVCIIVEGDDDKLFWEKILNSDLEFYIPQFEEGKSKKVAVIEITKSSIKYKKNIIGIIDADFDRIIENSILESSRLSNNVFMNDYHDLLVMIFLSNYMKEFLNKFINREKVLSIIEVKRPSIDREISTEEICTTISSIIFKIAFNYGLIRYLSISKEYNLDFKKIVLKIEDSFNFGKIIQKICFKNNKTALVENIRGFIEHASFKANQEPEIVQGHDLFNLLSQIITLRNVGDLIDVATTSPEEMIFFSILSNLTKFDFENNSIFKNLIEWADNNEISLF